MKDIFLLDMDETLLDFSKAERENFEWALRTCGVACSDALYARYHAINDALWKALERGEITRAVLTVRRFELLFEECGIAADADGAAEAYYSHFPEVCYPFAGAAEFVRTLSEQGRVYIVTNGGARIQRRHIALSGFELYLSGVFISEELGADKPSKAFADAVEDGIYDYDPARAVWIGDSLTSDMVCANVMGVDFILFAPSGAPQGYTGRFAQNYETLLSLLTAAD